MKVSPQEELRASLDPLRSGLWRKSDDVGSGKTQELMVSMFASNALGFGLGPLLSGAIGAPLTQPW